MWVLLVAGVAALAPVPARTKLTVRPSSPEELVPIAAGVAVVAVGGAALAFTQMKPKPAAAPTPAPPKAVAPPTPAPAATPVAEIPDLAEAKPPLLTKACWSGDSFGAVKWNAKPTNEEWLAACKSSGVVSYFDFGISLPPYVKPAKKVSLADWKAACEASGVTSFYDFGLRL